MNPLPPTVFQALKTGVEHQRHGRLAEAERIYREILENTPNQIDALHLLGIIALNTGQREKAVDLLGRAIAANPTTADFHDELGIALAGLGRLDEAIASHRKAIALAPQAFNPRFNLGSVLIMSHRFDEATTALRIALQLKPDSSSAHNSLGVAFVLTQKLDEAFAEFSEVKRLNPNSAQAHLNLGNIWLDCAEHDEAMACFDRAFALDPVSAPRLSNRIFAMHYHPRYDAPALLSAARQWDDLIGQPLRPSIRPHENPREPDRKLRIGYVSPDFRQHVAAHCILPLLANRDREQFEIVCYSSTSHEDAMTATLREHADDWRNIRRMGDQQVAETIRADRIDILVDLALHSLGNRLTVFARKPGPVQMTYLGYCSTTGLSAMDYRLSDPHVDPAEISLSDYREKTIRLPRTYLCYEPEGPMPEVSPPPCLAGGTMTFGCLNNFMKCSSDALELWARILQAVPESRLILHAKPGQHLDRVRERFERGGVSPGRLEFLGRQDWPRYVQTYSRIDIALDPFPYNGGITTCDALWMGVPVITLSGKTAVGRVGRSFLSNIGLSDLIAPTPERYLKSAVELANNVDRLKQLRGELRERMRTSPLMDARQLTRDIESAFRDVWQNYCKGE